MPDQELSRSGVTDKRHDNLWHFLSRPLPPVPFWISPEEYGLGASWRALANGPTVLQEPPAKQYSWICLALQGEQEDPHPDPHDFSLIVGTAQFS